VSRLAWFLVASVVLAVVIGLSGLIALLVLPDRVFARLGYGLAGERLVTGMLVKGTPSRPVLYVSSSDPRIGAGESGKDVDLDTNSGVISRLTWTGSTWERLDLVRGLPRSEENHATNGLALDPRSKILYAAQGSNTNLGARSFKFAHTPEYALSNAILAIDLNRIGNGTYDLPTLDDETRSGTSDRADPFGGNDGRNQARLVPGGPVQLFARGYRNPYDLVLTDRGRLYTSANGAARGWGGVPRLEGPEGRCTNEPHEPGLSEPDTFHLVSRGSYGGHPNPTRGNRSNTFNADRQAPVTRADPIECDFLRPSERASLTTFPTSTNGLAEYTASNFAGALRGDILAASFINSVYLLDVNETGDRVFGKRELFTALAPLDVTTQSDRGPFPGTIWVAEYDDFTAQSRPGNNLLVFEPTDYERARHWKRRTPSGLRRQEVSFVRAGQKLYLAGGSRRQQAYDPATRSWTDVAPLPRSIDHVQGVELGGRIYYVGGLLSWPKPHSSAVYVYDPASDSVATGKPMPRGRGAGGVAVHEGKIYYAGGLADGKAVRWFDEYDPRSRTWRRLPDMPRARDHFHAVVVDGRLYAIGGRDSELGAETDAVDAYDFSSGTWKTGLAQLPTPRGGFAAAVVDGEIVVIGGETPERAESTVEAYDPRSDHWRALEPMPTPRHGIQAAVCGGSIYVAAGGEAPGGGEPSDVMEVFSGGAGMGGCETESSRPLEARKPAFRRSVLAGTSSDNPTAIQFGPDGRLYVAQQDGLIKVYTVVRTAESKYVATRTEEIDAIQRIPNHNDDGSSVTDIGPLLDKIGDELGL
jgi:hypothetical protein